MADSATAQDISLNYERLSSMEEPLATEIGDLTLTLTGLVDAPLTADFEADLLGNFEAGALIQLQNRWRVSLAYFGQYATDEALNAPPDDEYTDNVGLSAGSVWGTAVAGYVSGIVREGTPAEGAAPATPCSPSTMRSAGSRNGAAATEADSDTGSSALPRTRTPISISAPPSGARWTSRTSG